MFEKVINYLQFALEEYQQITLNKKIGMYFDYIEELEQAIKLLKEK